MYEIQMKTDYTLVVELRIPEKFPVMLSVWFVVQQSQRMILRV